MKEPIVLVGRYLGSHREGHARQRTMMHFERIAREDLPLLRVCIKHPKAVYYDGQECPACSLESERARKASAA